MAGTFPARVHKIHNEFLDQTNKRVTAPKALNAIYRDKECPPWPIEGDLSIYPRESLCRIIISKQGKICGKRISDSCAGSLRQHVKTAHLLDSVEGRQRHLQKLELNTGRLGPPGREVVAEVVKEFIRRYKNPPNLDVIHFDEDSSSEDENGEEEEEEDEYVGSEGEKSEVASIVDHEQEGNGDGDGDDSGSQGERSELGSVEPSVQLSDQSSEEGYESATEQTPEKKGKEKILEVRGERAILQDIGKDEGGNKVKNEYEESEAKQEGNEKGDNEIGGIESIQEEMSEASLDLVFERTEEDEEEEEEGYNQVFEEDIENWGEERTWEISKRWEKELVMWDDDEEQEIILPPNLELHDESGSSKHQDKGKQREETPPKRQRDDPDEHGEDRPESKEPTSSKRQCMEGNKVDKNHDNLTHLPESTIKKEESPEPSEIYYLASENGVSSGDGAYLDHEGDISMSGF